MYFCSVFNNIYKNRLFHLYLPLLNLQNDYNYIAISKITYQLLCPLHYSGYSQLSGSQCLHLYCWMGNERTNNREKNSQLQLDNR